MSLLAEHTVSMRVCTLWEKGVDIVSLLVLHFLLLLTSVGAIGACSWSLILLAVIVMYRC